MIRMITILSLMLISSTVLAADISPECAARIKHHRTSIQTAAMATHYYQGLCKVDGTKPEDCPTTDRDVSNADMIATAVRKVSYSNKPLTKLEAQTLDQVCTLKNFDSDSIGQIIEEMPQ